MVVCKSTQLKLEPKGASRRKDGRQAIRKEGMVRTCHLEYTQMMLNQKQDLFTVTEDKA